MIDLHYAILCLSACAALVWFVTTFVVVPKLDWDDEGTRDLRLLVLGVCVFMFFSFVAVLWLGAA